MALQHSFVCQTYPFFSPPPVSSSKFDRILLRNRNNASRSSIFKCNTAPTHKTWEVAVPPKFIYAPLNEPPSNNHPADDLPIGTLPAEKHLQRKHFPQDFLFGAGTSAIQIEGDGTEGGRGPSTWDGILKAEEGKRLVDSYNLYMDDVKALKEMGVDVYRFSISWCRILPDGNPRHVNEEGVRYYTNLLKELEKNNIRPVVSLFHFDMPLALQKKYNGFMDRRIIKDFVGYCDVCFELFGKWVKNWITINEAATYVLYGIEWGFNGNTDDPMSPYVLTHNLILAHSAAAKLYRDRYYKDNQGEIGVALVCTWSEPYDPLSDADNLAVKNSFERFVGWYMGPLIKGDYPPELKNWVVGLPEFTDEEKDLVRGSCDFIGVNFYTGSYAKAVNEYIVSMDGHERIDKIDQTPLKNGEYIGPVCDGVHQIYVYPEALRKMLVYIKDNYNNPKLYITENGVSARPEITLSVNDARAIGRESMVNVELEDDYRINATYGHLCAVHAAIKEEVNVHGYYVWSLLDNNEFGYYDVRYGLVYIDYLDNNKRYPKKSAAWFGKFLHP